MFLVKVTHISEKVLYDGQAERVLLPGVMGCLEIAQLHAPIVSLLSEGAIILETQESNDEPKTIMIHQGLMRFDGQDLYAIVE